MEGHDIRFDVVIVGGGPAGSMLGSFLAMKGYRAAIVEQDIHPREHVGEALTPSTNVILNQIGFLEKMEDAGFVRKPGVVWTTPGSAPGKFISVRTAEFPFPGAPRPYSYNVERGAMDTMLLRHAHELGVKVLQGVRCRQILFQDGRAVGVRAAVMDGWERDLHAGVVVDASGRHCLMAKQLGLRKKDSELNQFAIWSWFRGVDPGPPDYTEYLWLHFMGLEKAWAWQIPLRNGVTSVGVVTDKADFQKSGRSDQDFFDSLVSRNRTITHYMRDAVRIRPWAIEGDYSYEVETIAGPGWMLAGDAMRFIDPIFSSGMDVAGYSALYGSEAIEEVMKGGDEEHAFFEYQRRMKEGVET